ncbi:MAG: hypothetical protein ACRC51_04065 [Cetobacterium sp.]
MSKNFNKELEDVKTELKNQDIDKALEQGDDFKGDRVGSTPEDIDALINGENAIEEKEGSEKEETRFKLKDPIGEVSELVFDFEKLKANDFLRAELIFKTKIKKPNEYIPQPSTDNRFCVLIAAILTGKNYAFFTNLSGRDYSRLASKVMTLLLAD